MEYKFLGRTGVKVSSLCFGTMSFGGDADEATSANMYHLCRDRGINFFDCANVYSDGKAEEILGNLIKGHRDEVIITSKAYFPTGSDQNARGASRRHIMMAVEESLRRLKTSWIDVFFIHRYDEYTHIEETLHALDDLVRQGKILYPAASNFSAWQVMKALGISAQKAWARFEVIQPMYNLVKRQAEVEILPMAFSEQLSVTPYSPLGGGLLSGKYGLNRKPEDGRLINNKMYQVRYGQPAVYEIAEQFSNLAQSLDLEPAALAIAWVGHHPAVTAPIIGARSPEQLQTCLKAAEIKLTSDLFQQISALSPTPPPATDRNEEQTPFNYGNR
jgi:aryl-alcohol dehydrogenase-like predicted oxidoreductase